MTSQRRPRLAVALSLLAVGVAILFIRGAVQPAIFGRAPCGTEGRLSLEEHAFVPLDKLPLAAAALEPETSLLLYASDSLGSRVSLYATRGLALDSLGGPYDSARVIRASDSHVAVASHTRVWLLERGRLILEWTRSLGDVQRLADLAVTDSLVWIEYVVTPEPEEAWLISFNLSGDPVSAPLKLPGPLLLATTVDRSLLGLAVRPPFALYQLGDSVIPLGELTSGWSDETETDTQVGQKPPELVASGFAALECGVGLMVVADLRSTRRWLALRGLVEPSTTTRPPSVLTYGWGLVASFPTQRSLISMIEDSDRRGLSEMRWRWQ